MFWLRNKKKVLVHTLIWRPADSVPERILAYRLRMSYCDCWMSVVCHQQWLKTGLPRSGKKFWKMKNVPGQGKVREFNFQSGKFRKNEKKSWKSQGMSKISKKLLVNWLLVFHKFQAILEKECFLT